MKNIPDSLMKKAEELEQYYKNCISGAGAPCKTVLS